MNCTLSVERNAKPERWRELRKTLETMTSGASDHALRHGLSTERADCQTLLGIFPRTLSRQHSDRKPQAKSSSLDSCSRCSTDHFSSSSDGMVHTRGDDLLHPQC